MDQKIQLNVGCLMVACCSAQSIDAAEVDCFVSQATTEWQEQTCHHLNLNSTCSVIVPQPWRLLCKDKFLLRLECERKFLPILCNFYPLNNSQTRIHEVPLRRGWHLLYLSSITSMIQSLKVFSKKTLRHGQYAVFLLYGRRNFPFCQSSYFSTRVVI